MKHAKGAKGDAHPDLITPTRALLRRAGKPYVIENVMGAQLIDPVVLNGFMFDLGASTADGTRFHLERQRKFEASFPLTAPTGWEKKAARSSASSAATCATAPPASGAARRRTSPARTSPGSWPRPWAWWAPGRP
jgi:hypothetical protein